MGGAMSWVYAARHPERAGRLVIVDVGPDAGRAPGIAAILGFLRQTPSITFTDPEEAVRLARERNPRPPAELQRQVTLANLVQREDGRWGYIYDGAHLDTWLESVLTADAEAALWALLPRIACPTLLVRGGVSDLLTPATAERMVTTIPECTLAEVANAGHGVHLDNPDAFLAAVRPFLLERA
jgi:pimeloyl-ACP methyl ester carboxylesterase